MPRRRKQRFRTLRGLSNANAARRGAAGAARRGFRGTREVSGQAEQTTPSLFLFGRGCRSGL
eukprot:scaffold103918_cov63-Phaeocystis_antarctica.AAC.3